MARKKECYFFAMESPILRSFIDLKKFPIWALAEEMRTICEPFFLKYNVNYVEYCLSYPDGRMAILSNDREYVQYLLNEDFFMDLVSRPTAH